MTSVFKQLKFALFLLLSTCTSGFNHHVIRTPTTPTRKMVMHSVEMNPIAPIPTIATKFSGGLRSFWKFTRPHTMFGSGVSVLSLFACAFPFALWGSQTFVEVITEALIPSLLMNIYITGLNQVTDVKIDKINKPFLPMASGEISERVGQIIVISSLLLSLFLVKSSAWPLQATVIGSGILGTIYSLPPFRLKRFPLLAATCIFVVRGYLVNMGFYLQAKMAMGAVIPGQAAAMVMYPESVLLSVFFALFGIVIALMKDVPDIHGDRQFGIPSFSVRLGAATMFRISCGLLFALLGGTSALLLGSTLTSVWPNLAAILTSAFPALAMSAASLSPASVLCRVGVAAVLALFTVNLKRRAADVDPVKPTQVSSFYMYMWKIFYGCYMLLPFLK